MRTWSGLVVLGVIGLGAAANAAPIKVTDLGSPIMVDTGKRPVVAQVMSVANGKNATFGFHSGQQFTYGSATAIVKGVIRPQILEQAAIGINRHGDFCTRGGFIAGQYSQHLNSKLYLANGTITPVPGIEGYNHVAVNHMNDAGVMVGYFARFWPDGDFLSDKPFYRRGDQVWSPTDLGAMYRVNNKGIALVAMEGIGGGIWSPETGFQSIAEFDNSEAIPDFNDHNEIIQKTRFRNGRFEVSILSATSTRKLLYPEFAANRYLTASHRGFNNVGNVTVEMRLKITGGAENRWFVYGNNAWRDLTDDIRAQIPSSWSLDKFGDIDDYGVAYGTATLPDGTKTVLMIETVPEPGTLAALSLGALLMKRRKNCRKIKA